MADWFENETFWMELYEFMFSEERFEEANTQVDPLLQLVGFESGLILDLCCGPGRFALPLARRGHAVTGVDRSPYLLERAKSHARKEGLQIDWVQEDMRKFVRSEGFDLALNMFTSFGYFDKKEDDVRVLENVLKSLRPGGSLVIDLMGKECLAKIYQPSHSHELSDGSVLLERHEIFDGWTRIRNEWILIKGDHAHRFRLHHTIYSGQELKDRLEAVGYRDVKLFGDLEGSDYGVDAERLIVVGRKPEEPVTTNLTRCWTFLQERGTKAV